MESKNLDKAIEIYSKLISGEEICKKHPDNGPLYDEFYGNAEVYDIVMNMMKKMNLSLYEYNDSLYITAGEGNRGNRSRFPDVSTASESGSDSGYHN